MAGHKKKKEPIDLRSYCVCIRRPKGGFSYLTKLSSYIKEKKGLWVGDVSEAYTKAKVQSYLNRHEKGEFGIAPMEGNEVLIREFKPL